VKIDLSVIAAGRRGDALALVAGALAVFGFAPVGLDFLTLVSLFVIAAVWLDASPKRAFWRGWLFGVGMFGLGVSWVYVSMNRFGGVPPPLAGALTALFVVFLALFPALVGYLVARLFPAWRDVPTFRLLFAFPMLWTLVEWLRGMIFTGFPWLTVGYSQIDSPLSGFAPVVGVYGVSYMAAMSAALILYMLVVADARRKQAGVALVLMWLVPMGLNRVEWSESAGEPMKVSLVQGNVPQDEKWVGANRGRILQTYAELSREHWDSALVVWPETAVPAFLHQVKPFLQQMAQEARVNGSELLVGVPIYNESGKNYFNSMVAMGRIDGSYEKKHLVPFGEYMPLQSILGPLVTFFKIPMSEFSNGNGDSAVLEVAGQMAGISICYEDAFGEEIVGALPDATLLINASNDAWFGDSMAPHQHMEIARMRALETARYMLRSTNTGVSAVIDEKGRVRASSPQFTVHVLTDTIQPLTGMTPYVVFGNVPVVVVTLAMLGLGFWLNRRRRKSREEPVAEAA